MPYRLLANLVVLSHLAFVLFAVFGGVLVFWWKRCAWLHLPTVLWAALIEFVGWTCPLTPLENWLRARGGGPGYQEGFIEQYILPVLYPDSLTRPSQVALGAFVLGINLGVYGWALRHRERRNSERRPPHPPS
ncbi:MAG TPA: DUF2784 domain-containing protein [Candidatus Polarisedimenticolia bacterium]|jgi:hypothetical protein|nr:DUF2784 domain-containing protein [Candidatus Polarisedimenticolia bacterium]